MDMCKEVLYRIYFVSSQPHNVGKTLKEHFLTLFNQHFELKQSIETLNITQSKLRIHHLM